MGMVMLQKNTKVKKCQVFFLDQTQGIFTEIMFQLQVILVGQLRKTFLNRVNWQDKVGHKHLNKVRYLMQTLQNNFKNHNQ